MTAASLPQAVIRAEPDGYDMAKSQLMGRQAAGHGFLRAAVNARAGRAISGFAPNERAAQGFARIVRGLDPAADVNWIHADQLGRLTELGVLYLADATVATHARLRLRASLTAFSLCGVTHTTASHGAMDEIAALYREAVAPWDALICTSTAVLETVRRVHAAESDYLRWRLGPEVRLPDLPQLPVIPLGVHCDDYAFGDDLRAQARQALDLAEDVVVGLFVGRLVFHAKAHPYPTLVAFQKAAERTGRPMALIFSGWFPNAEVEAAFRSGAKAFAPDVRVLFLEGREAEQKTRAWAAADIFVSPSDNIQETFGLTPIEAMAAGIPVVVSDWDGYKDTVRDGIDGFRVKTWAPGAGGGQAIARALETTAYTYDQYCWAAAQATAIDVEGFSAAVTRLADNADLRRTQGAAGRQRAREVYDWSVVYGQYQALWSELNARRAAAQTDPRLRAWVETAPKAAASRLDPFAIFEHYPTHVVGAQSRLTPASGATAADLKVLLNHPLFGALSAPHDLYARLFALAASGPVSVADAARTLGSNIPTIVRSAAFLAKLGLIAFEGISPG
ncbi:MAG: glycosyltransferase family 4 protein [Phenylobacterium sp.]|nr:glycosyltransferase family 4 protein [Phenylobacterium sp.]